ncbi:copper amine oxidase N-terminal domain-containing protein [Paenibacillus sp. SYP-B3998]|uniref:Copper amine oxidase N-terminal domain-containing protein n=1 Tax=Paenibacillus sp. SYP-B3998 TaxID=2678564 RepID=A0A6G4A0I5_9BACL|nr:copper amine oxidase N-terminal domain-containing protein [Paenibacillus sp. SYP-B3998]NEW07996.1 copper amine oxidase N-terminal domain-containing protein [Paenibacillus sp. SYP-B3998]
MKKKKLTGWISAALVVLMVTLTGCQAVQGLDFAQAIQNGASVKSTESKSTFQLELVTGNTAQLSAEAQTAITAFKNVKLSIANAKMQDNQHLSVDGALTYGKGTIPFKLNVDGTKFIVQIEGAPKPIEFDPATFAEADELTLLPTSVQTQLGNKIKELQPALIKFFLKNFPNPKNITVTSSTEQVNTETLNLQKVHLELNGSEVVDLLKVFLKSILADEEGLKELLGQLYDAFLPLLNEQGEGQASVLLKDKSLAVGFAYSSIHDSLEEAVASMDKATQNPSEDAQVQALLSAKTTLKTDFFIDTDKQIRKENFELFIPITDEKSGVSGIKLSYAGEAWNINKPVKADAIDTSAGVLNFESEPSFIYTLLNQLDKKSAFYTLLKNDLKVTKKEIPLVINQNSEEESLFDSYSPFINADNNTMVPVRFISEQLGADVKWNGDLKQVTIKDELTGTTIVLTLDSQRATVNGSPVQLESAATLHHGSTFVPIRFIAEKLGSTVSFNNDTHTVTIKRD